MRSIIGMAGAALLALVTLSCDTTQPLLLDQQTFSLQMAATGGLVGVFNVWNGYEDSNGDGQPDDTDGDGQPDFFLHCLTRTQTPTTQNVTSVPWGYTVSISVLRAGETEAELYTSPAAATDASNSLAEFDTTQSIFGTVPPAPAPVTIAGRTFRFSNGRILTRVRREVMEQTTSPLVELAPGTYGTIGQGRCSTSYPGPPRVDGSTSTDYPRPIVLGKGDTVTVEAKVTQTPTPGVTLLGAQTPSLAATFTLQNQPVGIRGTTAELTPGQGFRFSYTTR